MAAKTFAFFVAWLFCCAAFLLSIYVSFFMMFMFTTRGDIWGILLGLLALGGIALLMPHKWALPGFVGIWVIWLSYASPVQDFSEFLTFLISVVTVAVPLILMINATRRAHQLF
ncbi:MAG: hypothetical protein AAF986_05320 [Pseudomonadota bacterium]